MTAKLARNQNQLWTFSDAPPVPNRYPEVFQNFHIIKNVFTGESVQHNGDGSYAITAAGGTHVSAISLANNALQLFILRDDRGFRHGTSPTSIPALNLY